MRKGDLKHYINSLEQMEETTICSHELMRDQKKKKKVLPRNVFLTLFLTFQNSFKLCRLINIQTGFFVSGSSQNTIEKNVKFEELSSSFFSPVKLFLSIIMRENDTYAMLFTMIFLK